MQLTRTIFNQPSSMLNSEGAEPLAVESTEEPNVDSTTSKRRHYGRAMLWAMLAVTYWVILLVATHLPTPEAVVGDVLEYDKLLHAGAYFVLATVLFITARRLGSSSRWRTRLLIVLGVLIYGALDELTQPYFGRSCDLADWIADAVGIFLAFATDLLRKK